MEKYKVSSLEDITSELVYTLIQKYITEEVPRLERLERYYSAESDIKTREMKDSSKPNNRYANSFGSFITDTMQGYFLGKPIGYTSQNKEFISTINTEYKRISEHAHNVKIGKVMSIKGVSYELAYTKGKSVQLAEISPDNAFLIYQNTVDENVLAGVRFYYEEDYLTDETILKVELYTDSTINYFVETGEDLVEDKPSEVHYFGGVPLIQYPNNDELTGDYEKVIDLIDAYDLAVSDTANNLEYFADAYLVLKGVDIEGDDEDGSGLDNMKENRILLLDREGMAEWLTKGTSDLEVEQYKDRLKEDIHLFSHVPAIGGSDFGSATSGESLKYKLVTLENIISIKEHYFGEALTKRLDLITEILNKKGNDFDIDDIKITFNRNLPTNFAQLIDGLNKVAPFISQSTLLTQIPFVTDVEEELVRIEEEEYGGMYNSVLPNQSNQSVNNEEVV